MSELQAIEMTRTFTAEDITVGTYVGLLPAVYFPDEGNVGHVMPPAKSSAWAVENYGPNHHEHVVWGKVIDFTNPAYIRTNQKPEFRLQFPGWKPSIKVPFELLEQFSRTAPAAYYQPTSLNRKLTEHGAFPPISNSPASASDDAPKTSSSKRSNPSLDGNAPTHNVISPYKSLNKSCASCRRNKHNGGKDK